MPALQYLIGIMFAAPIIILGEKTIRCSIIGPTAFLVLILVNLALHFFVQTRILRIALKSEQARRKNQKK